MQIFGGMGGMFNWIGSVGVPYVIEELYRHESWRCECASVSAKEMTGEFFCNSDGLFFPFRILELASLVSIHSMEIQLCICSFKHAAFI